MEISSLRLDIDAESVAAAAEDLDAMVASATRAERASSALAGTAPRLAQGMQGVAAAADRSRSATNAATREIERAQNAFVALIGSGSQVTSVLSSQGAGFGSALIAADLFRRSIRDLDGALSDSAARGRSFEDSVTDLSGAMRPMLALGAAWVGLQVGRALLDMASAAAQAADEAARLRAQWDFIAGGSASGAAELAQAAEAADRLGASEKTLLDIRARLLPLERSGVTDRQSSLALMESLVGVTRLFNDEGEHAKGVLSAYEDAMSGVNVTLADYEKLAASLPGLAPRLEAEIANLGANGERDIYKLIRSGELTQEMLSRALPNAMKEFEEAGKTSLSELEREMNRLRENWNGFLKWLGQTAPVNTGLRAVTNTARAVNDTRDAALDFFAPPDSSVAEAARAAAQVEFARANAALQLNLGVAQREGWDASTDGGIRRLQAATDAAREQLEAAQSRIALLGAEETALASKASLEAEAESARIARARHEAEFAATEDGKRLAALNEIAAREAKLAEDRARNIGDAQTWAAIEAQIKADRKALDPTERASASSRDYAKEAEDAQAHAAAMLGAAEKEGEAARRREEIRVLSEQAARRSGYEAGTDEYARVLQAEAEKLRLEDQRKTLEDGRRKAAQAADAAAREAQRKADQDVRDAARLTEKNAQERADAEKRMAEMGREAQAAEEARAMAAAAASEAALAGSAEELLAIQRRTEALRNEADVRKAGQNAYDALDKGATEPEREAARAQAETAERAKQAAEIDEQRLGIAQSLIEARMREAGAGAASARMAGTLAAVAGAATAAEISALEYRAEAQTRAAEADRKALDARAALGMHASDPERDAAEAISRRLSAQEEELRLQREQLGVLRALTGLREQSADQAARAALATSTATAALTAQSSAELASLRSREESAARLLETEQSVRAAKERLGPAATDPQRTEVERLTRAAEATKEQIRLAGVQMQQVGALIALRERATDATARGALAERAGLSALGAQSRAEIAAIQAQSAALERQLDLEQRIRDAKAQLGPEAAAPQLAAAETSERALFAAQEQARVGSLLIQQAQALAALREEGVKATQAAALAEQARAEAIAAGSVLEFDAARRRAEQRQRDANRVDAVKAAAESVGPEADPARIEEAKRLAAARWDAAEAERVTTDAAEKRRALLQFEEGMRTRQADAETRLAAFRAADGAVEARLRAAEREGAAQEAIREALAQQLPLSESQIRAGLEAAEAAERRLTVETQIAKAAEDHVRAMERQAALTAARLRGPAAYREEEIRQAGIAAGYASPDDPEARRRAVDLARAAERDDLTARAMEALTAASDRYGESALRRAQADEEILRLKPYLIQKLGDEAAAEEVLAQARLKALAEVSPIYAQARDIAAGMIDPHERLAAFHAREVETREAIRLALVAQGVALEDMGRLGEEAYLRMQAAAAGFGDVAGKVSGDLQSGLEGLIFSGESLGDTLRNVALEFSKMVFSKATNPFFDSVGNIVGNFMGGTGLSTGSATLFDRGGYTGDGGKYDPAGIVHRGEVVWSQDDVRSWGGARFVDALRKSDPLAAAETILRGDGGARRLEGYAAGGIVDRQTLLSASRSAMRLAGANGAAASAGSGLGGFSGDLFGGFREHDGPMEAGRAYIVGEKPELFIPRLPGRIEPRAPDLARLMEPPSHDPASGEARLTARRARDLMDIDLRARATASPGELTAPALELERRGLHPEALVPTLVAPREGKIRLQTARPDAGPDLSVEGEAEPRGAKRAADLFADSGAHRVPLARLMSMAEAQGGEAVAREAQELKQVGLARRDLFRPPPTPAEIPPGRHDAASALRLTAPETQALGATVMSLGDALRRRGELEAAVRPDALFDFSSAAPAEKLETRDRDRLRRFDADALSPAARAHGAAMLHFFERGGWAAQGAKDEPAGIAHRDEAVWSQENLRAHGGAAFDAASNIIPFAGGGIVENPTLFNYGARQTGIMGEAGPEAILPLKRAADGRLGVAAEGGRTAEAADPTQKINMTINISTPDVAGFQRARGQIAADLSRAVASARRNL